MTTGQDHPASDDVAAESETVEELTGNEGGRWLITTLGSAHLIDLDRRTVCRFPGPNSAPSFNDVERPIRSLNHCRVGQVGYWTMVSFDFLLEYYWHRTSTIVRIERLEPKVEEQ